MNVSIDPDVRLTHNLAAEIAGLSLAQLTEAAIRYFYGSRHQDVLEIQKRAQAAVKVLEKGKPSPFKFPCPPLGIQCLDGLAAA